MTACDKGRTKAIGIEKADSYGTNPQDTEMPKMSNNVIKFAGEMADSEND